MYFSFSPFSSQLASYDTCSSHSRCDRVFCSHYILQVQRAVLVAVKPEISMEDAKEVHTSLRKAAGLIKFVQVCTVVYYSETSYFLRFFFLRILYQFKKKIYNVQYVFMIRYPLNQKRLRFQSQAGIMYFPRTTWLRSWVNRPLTAGTWTVEYSLLTLTRNTDNNVNC